MVDFSAITYMSIPLVSIGMLLVGVLLVIVAANFNLTGPYYMSFFLLFLEFLRLMVAYPFGSAPPVIWGLRGVFGLGLMFLIPKIFTAYMSGAGGY